MKCASCEEKEAVQEGFCPCCFDIYQAIQKNGGTISFRESLEIWDRHGVLTDEQRREWLEKADAEE